MQNITSAARAVEDELAALKVRAERQRARHETCRQRARHGAHTQGPRASDLVYPIPYTLYHVPYTYTLYPTET